MLSILRRRIVSASIQPWNRNQHQLGFSILNRSFCSSSTVDGEHHSIFNINSNGDGNGISFNRNELLSLDEVQKILCDVKADDVKVLPVPKDFCFADYMVIATGRSAWHVRNIAQSLLYKVKQKQKGAKRMVLPSVEGQEGGKWIVIDAGTLVIHALNEKVRGYYNLEKLWTSGANKDSSSEDLDKAFVKVRRTNNSKKPMQARA